ncbi:MAG TPA: membrane protein insertase YidC, partial [Coleofasciculaceae cyanobacterium]
QERYKNDPTKQQEELSSVYKEFGNPLAGCFPILVQMPVLIALFTTLRGSPFADVPYSVNLQILPQEQIERVQPEAFVTPPKNIYISDSTHYPVVGLLPGGTRLAVGDTTHVEFQTPDGKPLSALTAEAGGDIDLTPKWQVMKGAERVKINDDGTIEALQAGDVTLQGTLPGLAANKGFLFISALGHVGAVDDEGIHWDIVSMVLLFGLSLYVSQSISSQGATDNPQQSAANKLTPIIFSGMFLFFPLPAGVLMYMVVANLFQTGQAFILSREPLPENIQKLAEAQGIVDVKAVAVDGSGSRSTLPFEPKSAKSASSAKNTPNQGPSTNKPNTKKGKS